LSEEEAGYQGLAYVFERIDTYYYKNSRMQELDKEVGDIHGEIVNDKNTNYTF
jgi:hypothetical protein